MSAPLVRISGDALLFEAARLMRDGDIQHLVVTDALGSTLGVLTGKEILQAQQHSISILQAEIRAATCLEELRESRAKLPFLVKSLVDGGTRVEHVTRIMTAVSDAMHVRLVEMALQEVGPPPKPFAFMVLGSEARGEQTLKTDQDNAIVYDEAGQEEAEAVQAYSCALAGCATAWTPSATPMQGRRWRPTPSGASHCRPWREHFTAVRAGRRRSGAPRHERRLRLPLRLRRGGVAAALREHLRGLLAAGSTLSSSTWRRPLCSSASPRVLRQHPAGIGWRTPVGLQHQERDHSGGQLRPDLRAQPPPRGDQHLERLRRLLERGVLLPSSHDELAQAFTLLMQLRLTHQAARACAGAEPDNYIELGELTHLQRSLLKKVFSDIGVFQSRLRTDFARTA